MLLKGELGKVTLWPPCCCDPCGPGLPWEQRSQNELRAGMRLEEETLFRVQRR